MMLSSTIVIIIGFYIYCFPFGYFLMHLKETPKFNLLPFLVRLPIYLAVGLAGITLILSLIGRILLNGYIVGFVFWFSCLCYLAILRKRHLEKRKTPSASFSLNWGANTIRFLGANIIPLLLFLMVVFYFIKSVDKLDWPMPGDAIFHGNGVSLILEHKKIPAMIDPSKELTVYNPRDWYPLGFHALGAIISLIFGIIPGESILVVAAAITAVIPCMLFSVTYTKTHSTIFSLIPYLAGFVVYKPYFLYWIIGYFYNGTYPFLAGLLFMLAFVELISLSGGSNNSNSIMIPSQIFILTIIISIACIFTYTVFIFFIAFYFLSILIIQRKLIFAGITSRMRRLTINKFQIITLSGLSLIFLIILLSKMSSTIFLITQFLKRPGMFWKKAYLSFLKKDINGILIVLAFATIPVSILKWKNEELQTDILFLCTSVPIFLTLPTPMSIKYLGYLLPERTIMFLTAFSWIIFARFMYFTSDWVTNSHMPKIAAMRFSRSAVIFSIVVIYLMILRSFMPSLNAHLSGGLYEYGWYAMESSFQFDSEAAKWMERNIPSQDLILNDLSWVSLFLPSFSVNNVVFSRLSELSRAIECKTIWMTPGKPGNFTLLYHLIEKYEIKYIFTTSEWGFFDWWVWEGDGTYKSKPLSELYYAQKYDSCPFLRVRFAIYATRVYEVVL